jgi:hypothetical protein
MALAEIQLCSIRMHVRDLSHGLSASQMSPTRTFSAGHRADVASHPMRRLSLDEGTLRNESRDSESAADLIPSSGSKSVEGTGNPSTAFVS